MERVRSTLLRIPVLRKCFCLPLHTGILIFGYFNLILSGVVLPKMLRRLVRQLRFGPEPARLPLEFPEDAERADDVAAAELADLPQQAVTVAWMSVDVILSIILLLAMHTSKSTLLKVYLVLGGTLQVLTLSTDIYFYEFDDHYDNFVYFFFIGLNLYLLFMVYSYVYPKQNMNGITGVRYKTHMDEQPVV